MSSTPSPNPDTVLHDLLKEKSLWGVYWHALRIRRSRRNIIIAGLFLVAIFVLTAWNSKAPDLATQLYSVATVALSSTVSLLGFLIAGFSFFATVSDKKLFCRMAEITHPESGLSYLKYNLFIFMKVFAEFLMVCILSLALVVILQPSSAVRESIAPLVSELDWPAPLRIAWPFGSTMFALALGVFVAIFVYVLLELGSFIFNVHHVVMTNVSWEFFREHEQAEVADAAPNPEKKTKT